MGAGFTDHELVDMKESLEYIAETMGTVLSKKITELAELIRPAAPVTIRSPERFYGRTELWQVGDFRPRLILPRQLDRESATIMTTNAAFLIARSPFAFVSDNTRHGEGYETAINVPLIIRARCEIWAQPISNALGAIATMSIGTEHVDPTPDPGAIRSELEDAPRSGQWC